MIKRLIFVTGFAAGFVAGSASGRQSYEALKQNALKTWQDPKVQEKVSEGTEWVRSEVPVVGGKLSDTAKKASDTVGSKASEATSKVKGKAQSSSSGNDSSGNDSSRSADSADAQVPEPATTDTPMDPAEPKPATGGDQY